MRDPFVVNRLPLQRRDFLKGAAAFGLGAALPFGAIRQVAAADTPTLVNSIRSLTNPYHATWNKGGAAFAKSVGAEYVTLVTEGNSEKGVADIKAILSKTGGNCVINVDPNDSPDARPIVEACKAAGAYVVTQWNKPNDLHPWDHDPNYVAHISFNGKPNGKAMAEALFKSMGGEGGIVALGGILSNVPAIERKQGLDEALAANPKIKLLDFQVANWVSTEALEKTNAWLTQYGDEIKGIWAANDDMALGAMEAVKARGLSGIAIIGFDALPEALAQVRDGGMTATIEQFPGKQSSLGVQTLVSFLKDGTKPAEKVLLLTPEAVTKDNLNIAERLGEVK